MRQAEDIFAGTVGTPEDKTLAVYHQINASALFGGRRRLEAGFHDTAIQKLRRHFASQSFKMQSLNEMGYDLWLPTRFKRVPAEEGVQLVGSANLFEISPDLTKRIADSDFGDRRRGRVDSGWLLLARSGQTYGINGQLVIANKFHEGKVISDHVIRIAANADCNARSGYVYTALSHPTLGRPMVKALAYGSSIPEIEIEDIANMPIVRLSTAIENQIADLAERSAQLFAEADILETEIADQAHVALHELVSGDWSNFIPFER